MSNFELRTYINDNVEFLERFNDEMIYRVSLGKKSLSPLKENFDILIERTKLIVENYQEDLSDEVYENLNQLLIELVGYIKQYSQYVDSDYIDSYADIFKRLQSYFDRFKKIWQPIGWMFEKKNDNLNDEEFQKAQQINADLQTELAKVRTLANSLEQQAEEYRTRYSDINVNVELESQVNVFKTQAEQNEKESVKWFSRIIGSAVVLFITLIIIYCKSELPADFFFDYSFYNNVCETCGEHVLWVDMLRHIFFKLLILSVEIYVLTFCVKNYNACMHNKTNNEHRHNSFRAALHFYNTTTGEKRDEILIKVADAIFTYQKSGYYGKDSEPANPSLVQSVVDKVAGKG